MIALAAGLDFTNEENQAKLAEGLTFMAAHEGPYLIHCKEGKDRTGFVSALLECLMGATAEEIIADYMITYYNFYGVEPGTEKYDAIERDNLEKNLRGAFGVEDIRQADLALCAENYLRSIGLSDETISALKTNLARSYAG